MPLRGVAGLAIGFKQLGPLLARVFFYRLIEEHHDFAAGCRLPPLPRLLFCLLLFGEPGGFGL